MIVYVHSPDGVSVNSGISIEPREGWTPCVYEPPKTDEHHTCVCSGFIFDGIKFNSVFDIVEICEEVTEEDKDAALRRFGVGV